MIRTALKTGFQTCIYIALIAVLAFIMMARAPVCFAEGGDEVPVCHTAEEAGKSLRDAMKQRQEMAAICIVTDTAASESEDLINEIFEQALAHTGDPCEGDYLKFQYGTCDASARPAAVGEEKAVLITYAISYYDTAEQEQRVEEKTAEILDGLELDSKSDEEKVRAVYDYICDNVDYDYDNAANEDYLLKRTAYAALIDGKAVCQGYSAALYRLLLEAGVDNRIIFGTGITSAGDREDHTWNIVKLDDSYYNIDVTKGDELENDNCYLAGSGNFDEDHIRSEEYRSEDFTSVYSISGSDYGEGAGDGFDYIDSFLLIIRMLFQRFLKAL